MKQIPADTSVILWKVSSLLHRHDHKNEGELLYLSEEAKKSLADSVSAQTVILIRRAKGEYT